MSVHGNRIGEQRSTRSKNLGKKFRQVRSVNARTPKSDDDMRRNILIVVEKETHQKWTFRSNKGTGFRASGCPNREKYTGNSLHELQQSKYISGRKCNNIETILCLCVTVLRSLTLVTFLGCSSRLSPGIAIPGVSDFI